VWTSALSPLSPDAVAPTVNSGFAATTPVNSTTVPITVSATDTGGSGVAGYLITTTATQPLASAIPSGAPPTSFTVAGEGTYTLYPWAKDAGGNVSALYASPVNVVVDLTSPSITAFTAPAQTSSSSISINSFTGNDTGGSGIAGYMITADASAPAVNNPGWSAAQTTSYTVAVDGSYNLYPWIKDAAGNVSLASSPVDVLVDTTAPTGLALVSPAD